MNTLERFNAAIHFKPVDRVPTDLHNFMMCAAYSGLPFDEFVLDPRAMADAHIALQKEFGHDILLVENGTASLAQAMGCQVKFRKNDVPVVPGGAISSLDELEKLVVDRTILDAPLLKANFKAVQLLKAYYGDDVIVMGRGDQGPFSLASEVLGMNELLMDLMDEDAEEDISALLELCTEASIMSCEAMLDAGAHATSIGDSTAGPDVISPAMYRKFAFPYEKKVVEAIQKDGGIIALHICGNATMIVDQMLDTGADILEIDQKTELQDLMPKFRNRSAILGQISPETLAHGTVENVAEETEIMLDKVGGPHATGIILGPGCAMGGNTPYENVHKMLSYAK